MHKKLTRLLPAAAAVLSLGIFGASTALAGNHYDMNNYNNNNYRSCGCSYASHYGSYGGSYYYNRYSYSGNRNYCWYNNQYGYWQNNSFYSMYY